jgi:hypothetical protein
MNYRRVLAILTLLSMATIGAAAMQTREPTTVRKEVSLESGGKMITVVKLENTHSRSFTDPITREECELTKLAQGVIWRVTLEGSEIPVKEVRLQDERDRKFQQTCWVRQAGGVYQIDATGKRIGGGPRTEFLTFGPDDSKKVKVFFGDAWTEIEMGK